MSEDALKSMAEISDYISYDLASPIAAKNLINLIIKEISGLSYMPERIRLVSDEPWHSHGIHRMNVKNYYIYFWINEEESIVKIFDVTYARQDQKKQLERIP